MWLVEEMRIMGQKRIIDHLFTCLMFLLIHPIPNHLLVYAQEKISYICPSSCICDNIEQDVTKLVVNCSQSNIKTIPDDIPQQTQKLILSNNDLVEVDLSSLNLPHLKKLVLQHCMLKRVAIGAQEKLSLPYLEMIDLSYNNLEAIPENLPLSLKTLLLSHNSIKAVAYREQLSYLKNLEELFLDHNLLTEIQTFAFDDVNNPGESTLSSLHKLALNSNKILFVDDKAFSGLSALTALTLSNNKLISLQKELFSGLESLGHLDISQNSISHIDKDTFHDMPNLKYLNLNRNKLQSFPSGLPMLEWLDISHNHIHSITKDSKPDIYPVEVLNMANNPLHCDCHLLWLKELYDQQEYLVKHIDLDAKDFIPSCASPKSLAGETWDLLGDDMFRCLQAGEGKMDESSVHIHRDADISSRIGVVTDSTIQVIWSSSTPAFYLGNVLIQYYVFGHRSDSMKHLEVAAAQRKYVIRNLRSSTNYLVCVRPQEVSEDRRESNPKPPLSLDDCIEVATKEPLPPPLASRMEVVFYYILGMLATFIGIFAGIGGCAMIFGLWNQKSTHWSAKYVDDSYMDSQDGGTYATDEPITKENKPHKD